MYSKSLNELLEFSIPFTSLECHRNILTVNRNTIECSNFEVARMQVTFVYMYDQNTDSWGCVKELLINMVHVFMFTISN